MKRVPLSAIAGALLVLLGSTVMVGLWLQSSLLVHVLPGLTPMVFNAALCFVLAGGALLTPFSDSRRHERVVTVLGGALAIIAALVLAEHLSQSDLGIDWPSLHAWLHDSNPSPGRMSAGTAIGFLMSGAVLSLATRVRRPWMGTVVRVLTLGVGAIGALGLAGYFLNAQLLFPEYLFADVAAHTATGLVVLAFGLGSAWKRFEWARVPLFPRADDRITFVGATVLVAIALAAGIASFAILQGRVQTLVSDNVHAALTRHIEMFRDLVELREVTARIAATRPAALRNVRVIHAGRDDDGSNIANLKAAVESFLKEGFSAIAFYDVDGAVVASGGVFVKEPLMSVTLATPDKPELLWDGGGFLLRHRMPMRDPTGEVGTALAEQPLPVLTRLAQNVLGTEGTGDMDLCVRRGEQLQCFPQRLNRQVFFEPLVNVAGEYLPMTRALLGETGVVISRDYRAQNVLAAYGPIGNWGLGMVVKIDAAEVFRPIREQLELALGLLLLLAGGGTLLLRLQLRPLATKLVNAGTQASAQLEYLADYDPLTGLANRGLFHKRLEQFIDTARHEAGKLGVLLFDIERFRTINETLGRAAGDELLKQIAARARRHVDDPSGLARVGGDRFAAVVPGIPGAEGLLRRIEQEYREIFGTPFQLGDTALRVSARFGITLFPDDGGNADSLLGNTEAALKKAKAGGDKFLFYTQKMNERVAENLALDNKLRMALEREEFVLHYQPKVDLDSGAIVGLEALIRWQSPELGLVPPMKFIPLLEETGLILEVGSWALRRAAVDHRRWREAGLKPPRVAVNVSPIQLRQRDFVPVVEQAIIHGIAPTAIDLEITESLIMHDVEATIEKLKLVRALGLKVAIDDFGTGYSSLAYLARLPVHELKIDRSFIITMLKDPAVMTLVTTVITMAHALKLTVVAEGVDEEGQAKELKRLGCDQMQGYLFSKPIDFDAMTVLLGKREEVNA